MTIVEEVKQKYNIDLPVSYGKINDQIIMILNEGSTNYVNVERLYIKYFLELNGYKGKVTQQSLLTMEGRNFDKLRIEGVKGNGSPLDIDILFDISNYSKNLFPEKFIPVLMPYCKENKWGFCTPDKKMVINCIYDNVWHFSEGLAIVTLNRRWGFIDRQGKQIVPCVYDGAGDFSAGLACVKLNGKWGFINKKGKQIFPCMYDEVRNFFGEFTWVKLNGSWNLIDNEGKRYISDVYDEAGELDMLHGLNLN